MHRLFVVLIYIDIYLFILRIFSGSASGGPGGHRLKEANTQRAAILTGFTSVYCMAAVRSMALISDAWLWPMCARI